ncbi:MAG TPA: DUF1697 domain-containing protein [Terriglobales bacterium]|nr:DUF1697 domain-containing protein [Terriglobales bacterium]
MMYVALLRGINVAGKHLLPMEELAAIVSACKCTDVRTYIQSGNIVFAASTDMAKRLPALLTKRIEERFGFATPVVLRSRDELARVVHTNPFVAANLPQNTLHVYFLNERAHENAVQSLDQKRSMPDEFRIIGREIYLHLPNGMGRTKLTNAFFESRLKTVATARNWTTVQRLLEMMQS